MTDLTPETIAELRGLLDAATPGPWSWRSYHGKMSPILQSNAPGRFLVMGFRRLGMQDAQPEFRDPDSPSLVAALGTRALYEFPDAKLIPAAVNALPALLDAATLLAEIRDQVTRGALCPMCATGMSRRTVGMVCQLCGTDYGRPSKLERELRRALDGTP